MKKNVKKLMHSIKDLKAEKKSWSIYHKKQYVLDMFDEDEEETPEYLYEASVAHIKWYNGEIKRLKNILAC
jgi:hypothetical protein